jgi:UDP-N-acetylglucosamine--N-acetylmuramyl-(pentapeptide) pyrophosphoryl-undecaprenol N-acetylglucosamine transferase
VTPALAVAEALNASGQPVRTVFCGPAGGVAERMVSATGGAFVPLEIHPLRGEGAVRLLRGIARLPEGAHRSFWLLRSLRPDLVVGTGAHTSGPLVALAAVQRIPTLIFEANVDVGLANRWLGPLVHGVAVAWPQTLASFPGRGFVCGWPVGRAIRETLPQDTSASDRFHVLILGGSAGASALDRAVRDALPHVGSLSRSLSVVHQASLGEVAVLREHYRAAGVEARVEPFFPDLVEHYVRASLVITRAGATTLAELAAVGRPAILVPLSAAGNHQQSNAAAWEDAGCARCIQLNELSGEALAASVLALAQDRAALKRMGEAARSWHRPDAAARIAEWCRLAMRIQ